MVQAQAQIQVPDEELVTRFQRGEATAFDEVVARYSAKVLTICTYYLRDPHEARDVSQEVFLKVYRGLASFRGDAKLSTWIHTIAMNTCRNQVGWFKRWFTQRTDLDQVEVTLKSSDPGPDTQSETRERDAILRREIQNLPAKFKEIVILKDLQERSYEEIGEILAINQGTVKSRLHRAREALVERLKRTRAFE